jgi:hypothetical protein
MQRSSPAPSKAARGEPPRCKTTRRDPRRLRRTVMQSALKPAMHPVAGVQLSRDRGDEFISYSSKCPAPFLLAWCSGRFASDPRFTDILSVCAQVLALTALTHLSMHSNKLPVIPDQLFELTSLRALILSDNRCTSPARQAQLTRLLRSPDYRSRCAAACLRSQR